MLVPAGLDRPDAELPDEVRAFYEYHATLVEPWDGPAALVASDGAQRRRAARPQRPAARRATSVTRDGLVVHRLRGRRARPRPGRRRRVRPRRPRADAACVDTVAGRIVPRRARSSASSPRRRPYRRWLDRAQAVPRGPAARSRRADPGRRALDAPAAGLRLHRGGAALLVAPMARERARSRSARWATTRRWRRSRERPQLAARRTSSSTSPRSRTRRSTRSARRW